MSAFRTARRNDFFNVENGNESPSGTFLAQKVSASYLNNVKRFQDEKNEQISAPKNEIGYVNLLSQIYSRSVKRGFTINLMITGTSSLGKSSFINSLLMCEFYNPELNSASFRFKHGKNTKPVEAHTVIINESKIKLELTILDTPGFGELINNSNCFKPLVEEIENRYQNYLKQELKVDRTTLTNGSAEFTAIHIPNDPRVHACLYFLPPHTNGLTAFDLEAMLHLHKRVNLIPVIAKADSLTPDECRQLKVLIIRQLAENNICVFNFEASSPSGDSSKAVYDSELNKYRQSFPFAIVSSNTLVTKPDGSKVRGRQYPWGIVETDSLEHNDFQALKTLLINAHLHDLIDKTHFKHYAIYRQEQLATIKRKNSNSAVNGSHLDTSDDGYDSVINSVDSDPTGPLYQLEIERREHRARLIHLENEMEAVFEQKVRERAAKFQEREDEFERQSAKLLEKVDEEMRLLEQQERHFQLERAEWESVNKETLVVDICEEEKENHELFDQLNESIVPNESLLSPVRLKEIRKSRTRVKILEGKPSVNLSIIPSVRFDGSLIRSVDKFETPGSTGIPLTKRREFESWVSTPFSQIKGGIKESKKYRKSPHPVNMVFARKRRYLSEASATISFDESPSLRCLPVNYMCNSISKLNEFVQSNVNLEPRPRKRLSSELVVDSCLMTPRNVFRSSRKSRNPEPIKRISFWKRYFPNRSKSCGDAIL